MTNFKTMFRQLSEANPNVQFAVRLKQKTAIVGSVPVEELNLPAGWEITNTPKCIFIQNFGVDIDTKERVFFEYIKAKNPKLSKAALWLANLTWRTN